MEVTMAVVADAANRAEGGRLNLLGVFSDLFAQAVPAQHPTMALVLVFQATALERGTTPKIAIKLVNEDGKQLFSLNDSQIIVPNDPNVISPSPNLIVNLNGIMFENWGTYRFDIEIDGETKAQVPIYLRRFGT